MCNPPRQCLDAPLCSPPRLRSSRDPPPLQSPWPARRQHPHLKRDTLFTIVLSGQSRIPVALVLSQWTLEVRMILASGTLITSPSQTTSHVPEYPLRTLQPRLSGACFTNSIRSTWFSLQAIFLILWATLHSFTIWLGNLPI